MMSLQAIFLSLEVHRKRKNRKACSWGALSYLPKATTTTTTTQLQKAFVHPEMHKGRSSKLPRSITSQ
ncbi:hypothetical protein BDA96_06G063900 [Sorghum bicolor]|uniref:Uncharacterized protein n=2 Tax=Sorghum bicolor TaxID=4558 RepID=A0A1Z5RCE6_SORBI|nr:hypothetical protein BDA96_06G063900 [Sorghum bicolor]OQU81429.1 hypothetical protein SORBI_3006G057050 [Sorghum bicolor]OQU81430.1 hypothetical protein SORBI_3006G057050 [Sorghum bicolor]